MTPVSDSSVVSRIAHRSVSHQPSLMPKDPWWEHLEPDFYKRPEGFQLGRTDQLRVSATAALDVGLRTAAASLMGGVAFPIGFNPLSLKHAFDDRVLYETLVDTGRGRNFFPQPPKDIPFRHERPRGPHFDPDGGVCEQLVWESPFHPFNPRLTKAYLKHKKNAQATARYWRHKKGPRPTIILIHGFVLDQYWVNEKFFRLQWFYHSLGVDTIVFTLPFHGPRQANYSLFSGHGFFGGGLSWINECFRQTVLDFRSLLDYLQHTLGVEKIGVTGISLGGYTTSLLAALEERLDFAIPNVPVVTIPDLVLEWNPVGYASRAGLFLTNKTIQDIRHMLSIHCPLTYRPVLPKERLMIIGGVGDRLAPPKHSRILWDHWERPRIHWFPGNHIIHLDQGAYLRQIARFLAGIGFIEPRRVPSRELAGTAA